ncbi:hypothetical protein [uncultured Roseovarius sp.]|uniref:hypothetical protein n=1 Tax=uncultured Roseovarius sp. TaxID=293344 RepID=UPI002620C360|nr:hypothetical protein [uncultured Roseovarius sp.]
MIRIGGRFTASTGGAGSVVIAESRINASQERGCNVLESLIGVCLFVGTLLCHGAVAKIGCARERAACIAQPGMCHSACGTKMVVTLNQYFDCGFDIDQGSALFRCIYLLM